MLFLYLLGITCVLMLGWELRSPERIYQFPFLISAIFLAFIMPQAVSLVANPLIVSGETTDNILLFSCLCLWLTLAGYQLRPSTKLISKFNIAVNANRLFRGGIVLILVSFLSSVALRQLAVSTNEVGNWTGPATILYFFSSLRYIAVAIFLNAYLQKQTTGRLVWLLFGLLPIVETVLVYGRRAPTFTLFALIGASLFFVKRVMPPRALVVGTIFLMAFLIPLIGQLRGEFWAGLFAGDLRVEDILSGLDRVLLTGDVLELRNGAMLLEAANKLQKFGLGTGFWDDIVFRYVPGQLVGYDIKQALQFDWGVSTTDLITVFGTAFSTGSTKTGVGDSYAEFGYFGCLLFGAIAYFYRHIWISAFYCHSVVAQILYIGLISPALLGVTHGIGRFIQDAIFQFIFILLVVKYSKLTKREHAVLLASQQAVLQSRPSAILSQEQ